MKRIRLKGFDYRKGEAYFVTICTYKRAKYFGNIVNGKMVLSAMGIYAKKYWEELPLHFSNMILDEFIVMPDHMHALFQLIDVKQEYDTHDFQHIPATSVSAIVRSYKSAVSRDVHQNISLLFQWQRRFYDSIIHDEMGLQRVRLYIKNNPKKYHQMVDDGRDW